MSLHLDLDLTMSFWVWQQHLQKVFEKALDNETVVQDMSGQVVKVSSATLQTMEHITKVLRYLYKNDLQYVTDYRMAVVKATVYTRNANTVSWKIFSLWTGVALLYWNSWSDMFARIHYGLLFFYLFNFDFNFQLNWNKKTVII